MPSNWTAGLAGIGREQPAGGGEQHRHDEVPLALLLAIGAPSPPDHADDRANLRNRRQQADRDVARVGAETLDDQRRPDRDHGQGVHQAEVSHPELDDRGRGQLAEKALLLLAGFENRVGLVLRDKRLRQIPFLLGFQPSRLLRRVVEIIKDHESQDGRRQAFQQKQPLPAFQAERAVQAQNVARENRCEPLT